jgi:transcription termination factor NusB
MPSNIVKKYAKETNKSIKEVEALWNDAKDKAREQYDDIDEDSPKFYSIVTGILKNMLKIEEEINLIYKFNTMNEDTLNKIQNKVEEDDEI